MYFLHNNVYGQYCLWIKIIRTTKLQHSNKLYMVYYVPILSRIDISESSPFSGFKSGHSVLSPLTIAYLFYQLSSSL